MSKIITIILTDEEVKLIKECYKVIKGPRDGCAGFQFKCKELEKCEKIAHKVYDPFKEIYESFNKKEEV
jgi:hypothetical protein